MARAFMARAGELGVDPARFTATDAMLEEVVTLRRAVRALFAKAVAPGEPSSADAARLPGFTEAVATVNAATMAVPTAPRLDWPEGGLIRVRVTATSEGSAKPSEVAKALGVWGSDDPRAEHALVARLGVVAAAVRPVAQLPTVAGV